MADSDNSGQFGEREDTEQQASAGGQASSGSFGDDNGADPSEAGKASSGSFGSENGAGPSEAGESGGKAQSE